MWRTRWSPVLSVGILNLPEVSNMELAQVGSGGELWISADTLGCLSEIGR